MGVRNCSERYNLRCTGRHPRENVTGFWGNFSLFELPRDRFESDRISCGCRSLSPTDNLFSTGIQQCGKISHERVNQSLTITKVGIPFSLFLSIVTVLASAINKFWRVDKLLDIVPRYVRKNFVLLFP